MTHRGATVMATLGSVGVSVALWQLFGGWALLLFWSFAVMSGGARNLK